MTVTLEERLAAELGSAGPTSTSSADSSEFVASILASEQRRARRQSAGFAMSTMALLIGLASAVWLNDATNEAVTADAAGAQDLAPILIDSTQNGATGFGSLVRVVVAQTAPLVIAGWLALAGAIVLIGRYRRRRQMRRWRGWPVLAGFAGLVVAGAAFVVSLDVYYLPSYSMAPLMSAEGRVLVDPGDRDVKVGDVIVHRDPEARNNRLDGLDDFARVRRVIGVGGDLVESQDGQLLVNGRVLTGWVGTETQPLAMDPVSVPEGQLFLMGDNHQYSTDSRFHGTVPVEDVLGTVKWRTAWSP